MIETKPDTPASRSSFFALPSWKRVLGSILTAFAIFYAGLATFLYVNQDAIVFPGAFYAESVDATVHPKSGYEVVALTTPQLKIPIKAVYGPAMNANGLVDPDASKRPTMLFFYGNGSSLASTLSVLDRFRRMDVNVVSPDYPGYGMSSGKPSEKGCYDAAEATYEYVTQNLGAPKDGIIAAGRSLGSGVAIDLAVKHPMRGVIVCSAYTNFADMGAYRYPIFPAPLIRLLLKYRFPSDQRIGKLRCPILLAHGDQDVSVPYAMAARLIRAAHAPVTFVSVPGIGHNDFFSNGGEFVYPRIASWLKNLPATTAGDTTAPQSDWPDPAKS